MREIGWAAAAVLSLVVAASAGARQSGVKLTNTAYLTWTSAQAQQIGRSTRVNGRVGGVFDLRLLHTERAFAYKLRATWLTAEVIRATARLAQLSERLSNDQTDALVMEAEAAGDTVIMVEIDPNEGSGVIPLDWLALLGPKESGSGAQEIARGTSVPRLREVRALAGAFRRDYNYEVLWVVFPLVSETGRRLFPESVSEAELVIRIHSKEGRVKWPVPESIKHR